MTEEEIEAYLDDFEAFKKLCKRRKIRIYPNKKEYVAMYSQEDVLALWHTFRLCECTKSDSRLDALVKSNPLLL